MIALARPPRATAPTWTVSTALLARDLARQARARQSTAAPRLPQQFLWQVDLGAFAFDVLGVTLDDWQLDALHGTERFRWMNLHRQAGKTLTASILLAHTALFAPASLGLCVAPALRQSGLLLRAVRGVLLASRMAGAFLKNNVLEVELENTSRVVGLPPNAATIRGYSAPAVVVLDEASRISDEVFTEAIRPMQATNSEAAKTWAISTPWGQRGWWYQESKDDAAIPWARCTRAADRCPRITPAFLAQEESRMGRLRFQAEYGCLFSGTKEQLFGPELRARMFRAMPAALGAAPRPAGPDVPLPPRPAVAPVPVPAGAIDWSFDWDAIDDGR